MEAKLILTISNKAEYERLGEFLKGTTIQAKLLSYITEPTVSLSDEELRSFKYLPNPDFKTFCGSENLNAQGYISLEAAYNLVLEYGKGNSLYYQTHIDLDRTLAEALNSEKHSILISDLLPTFVSLFKVA
jgi:hypothetical protein